MSETETKIIEVDGIYIQIPECCREGYADCPHIVKHEREKPKNIAV